MHKVEPTFLCFSGKPRGKKIRGKSRGERDLLKERLLRRDNSVPDDKDETSSTTTDSSAGGEQEDKVSEWTFCSQEIEAAAMFSRGGTTQAELTLSCIHHHQGCGCGSAPPPRGGKWGWQAQAELDGWERCPWRQSRVQFSPAQDGICVLRKAHAHSALSPRSFPSVALLAFRLTSAWQIKVQLKRGESKKQQFCRSHFLSFACS